MHAKFDKITINYQNHYKQQNDQITLIPMCTNTIKAWFIISIF